MNKDKIQVPRTPDRSTPKIKNREGFGNYRTARFKCLVSGSNGVVPDDKLRRLMKELRYIKYVGKSFEARGKGSASEVICGRVLWDACRRDMKYGELCGNSRARCGALQIYQAADSGEVQKKRNGRSLGHVPGPFSRSETPFLLHTQ